MAAVQWKSRREFMKNNKVSRKLSFNMFDDHKQLTKRIQKTFYYGKYPRIDRPSLALTSISVDLFKNVNPNDHLGCINMNYAADVGREACISPCSMMLAMVYIERLHKKNPECIQSTPSSQLFLITMMIATKFLNDDGVRDEVFNGEWAAAGDIQIKDFNALERKFLVAIDWDIFIGPVKFNELLNSIETLIAISEGKKRGWFSYTDMDTITNNLPLSHNWKLMKETILKVIAFCSVTYAAATYILLWSASLVFTGLSTVTTTLPNQTYPTATNDLPALYPNRTDALNICSISANSPIVEINNLNFNHEWVNDIVVEYPEVMKLCKLDETSLLHVNRTRLWDAVFAMLNDDRPKLMPNRFDFCDGIRSHGFFTQNAACA